ncbi:MAG: hypothetical protein IKP93_00130 [Paludibacteraceae bacterium]|nr:hypothetical protein [Paludibacteraceae bacterium]
MKKQDNTMTRTVLTLSLVCLTLVCFAQPPKPGDSIRVQRAYGVFVSSETDSAALQVRNDRLSRRGGERSVTLAALGSAIAASYGNKLIQETVNFSSKLFEFGGKVLRGLIYKNRDDREAWLRATEWHNHFTQRLNDDTQIDDFYYTPSHNGAFDPMDMKFNGFGCMCYMKPGRPDGKPERPDDVKPTLPKSPRLTDTVSLADEEIWEFYLLCKLRDDSIGIDHMNNHSRFYMTIDRLVFDTRHTSLPNDSVPGKMQTRFDFRKRKDLTFSVNVKIFSSWVNEAAMLIDNQQIGEFNITAKIDSADVDPNGIFVYDPVRHRKKVSITGDSFVVPRSFTGTSGNPTWGTGQYRLEVTLREDCALNRDWYRDSTEIRREAAKPQEKRKDPKDIPFRWDKEKWGPEWREMQAHGRKRSIVREAWQSTIKTAYVKRDWVQEILSPLSVVVAQTEQTALGELLHLTPTATCSSAGTAGSSAATAGSGAAAGGAGGSSAGGVGKTDHPKP